MSTRECLTTALGFEVYASRLEQSARKNHVKTINKTGQHDYLYTFLTSLARCKQRARNVGNPPSYCLIGRSLSTDVMERLARDYSRHRQSQHFLKCWVRSMLWQANTIGTMLPYLLLVDQRYLVARIASFHHAWRRPRVRRKSLPIRNDCPGQFWSSGAPTSPNSPPAMWGIQINPL